jgi:methionyl-tRNA formyltransferase
MNWALFDEADTFGVTAHLMDTLVDSGPILAVKRLGIESSDNLPSLIQKTHDALIELALELVGNLLRIDVETQKKTLAKPLPIEWAGPARKVGELHQWREVDPTISAQDLTLRVRAFHLPSFPLFVNIGGRTFTLAD